MAAYAILALLVVVGLLVACWWLDDERPPRVEGRHRAQTRARVGGLR